MKNFIWVSFLALAIWGCREIEKNQAEDSFKMLAPTEGALIKLDMEEGGKRTKREAWLRLIHQSAPDVDWRSIEAERAWKNQKAKTRFSLQSRDNSQSVVIANGEISGRWIEKGSDNQAGSVIASAFHRESDELYLVSAGGSLYKSDILNESWSVINDQLRFDGSALDFVEKPFENRLVGIVNRVPAYSDDMGSNWEQTSNWISYTDDWGGVYHTVVIPSKGIIVTMAKRSYWENLALYVSSDGAESFQKVRTFGSHDPNKYKIAKESNTDQIYLVDKVNDTAIDFYRFEYDLMDFSLISTSQSLGFGSGVPANLGAVQTADSSNWFYIFNENNVVHFSQDLGMTWDARDTIPERPWGVGIFVSPTDPNLLLIGGVECHRSDNGGRHITTVNKWPEYYNQVEHKLHADMMYFREFETSRGESFIAISNHGGLNLSYDQVKTTPSISLKGLNVSQYYSVRTDPFFRDYIYAGSQDQGFQRSSQGNEERPIAFDQIISGDYGHIAFSGGGGNLWTVYPGGWVIYYDQPRTQRYPLLSYTLESDDETVWLPPLCELSNSSEDAVLMAGGNIYGNEGSYLIKLKRTFDDIVASQFDFDFKAASGGGTISAIHVDAYNADVIYVATTNGRFFTSNNGGLSWVPSRMQVPGGHYLYGATIATTYDRPGTIFMGGSGYSNAPVARSIDGGNTFRPYSEGMPSTTVFQMVIDPEGRYIFAATEAGPYVNILSEGIWYPMAENIAPEQTYWSVEYLYPENIVRFGTYGRGIWDFTIEDINTRSVDKNELTDDAWYIYPNPGKDYIRVSAKTVDVITRMVITNVQGAKIAEFTSYDIESDIDISHLYGGTYNLGIETGKGQYHWKQFIKVE